MPDEATVLRNFLELVEAQLDVTEPAVLDESCAVVSLAPAKGGLVGLDMDTGRPVRVGWKYKTIDEKPVIINAGSRQIVIPPKPPPLPVMIAAVAVEAEPEPEPEVLDLLLPRIRQRIVDT